MPTRLFASLTAVTSLVVSGPWAVGYAQTSEPGLVVPVPPPSAVTVRLDSFPSPNGRPLPFTVTRSGRATQAAPIVVFANFGGTFVRNARAYQEWARLITTRGFAGVLYDAPDVDFAQSADARTQLGVATLDSLMRALAEHGQGLGVDPRQVVVWAGSSQTMVGTPFALQRGRAIAGYVLYYGSGTVEDPRADVPVLMVRAGQDSPTLNADMDSLALRLTRVGAPLTVVHHPAGAHAFDIVDATATTAAVIEQTLAFMTQAIDPAYHASIIAGAPLARAAAAFAGGRWGDAVRLYRDVAASTPDNRIVTWRLGLAQLANAQPDEALASFDRARMLGQGGARDIGLPATRAALRARRTDRAVEWLNWALQAYPVIRAEVARDAELAPLLQNPRVRGAS